MMVYYIVSGVFLLFFWCPCMAINVNLQYNGGLLPGIILLTQCYFHRRNPCKCHEEVLYLQPLIPPSKRFDISPPLRAVLMGTKSCTKILIFSTRFSCENLAVEDFVTLLMGKKSC